MSSLAFLAPVPVSRPPTCRSLTSRTALLPARAPLRRCPPPPVPAARPRPPRVAMALSSVVIAGGSGFVGTHLARVLLSAGAAVTILTRSSSTRVPPGATAVVWAPDTRAAGSPPWADALRRADLVVNLAGHPVLSRWDDAGRTRITQSRLAATNALVDAILALPPADRPRCLASASAVGYYGSSASADFDESASPAPDFLADVCVKWEAAADRLAAAPETRVVKVRTGIVMGVGGGAMAKMIPAFKFFVGGPIGSGQQWVPWVHIHDLARVYIAAGEDDRMRGVYNGTAPNPVTMAQLAEALGRALGRPSLFPVPEFVIKAGFGEASSVLLQGQRVFPKRLLDLGFKFEYPQVDDAMNAIAKEA